MLTLNSSFVVELWWTSSNLLLWCRPSESADSSKYLLLSEEPSASSLSSPLDCLPSWPLISRSPLRVRSLICVSPSSALCPPARSRIPPSSHGSSSASDPSLPSGGSLSLCSSRYCSQAWFICALLSSSYSSDSWLQSSSVAFFAPGSPPRKHSVGLRTTRRPVGAMEGKDPSADLSSPPFTIVEKKTRIPIAQQELGFIPRRAPRGIALL
mmetsp:Transcript_18021/g.59192  ORF Transcript_18021/g.59192 Transcript_18021/m.59192 type:complete len:211 (-) Transcript_18021:70-702(-)